MCTLRTLQPVENPAPIRCRICVPVASRICHRVKRIAQVLRFNHRVNIVQRVPRAIVPRKRHHFKTRKESHGGHFFVRHAGSIGSRKPQHTLPGTRMGGQHGNARVTTRNLEVIRVDSERNLIFVRGAVPGHKNGLVKIRKAVMD